MVLSENLKKSNIYVSNKTGSRWDIIQEMVDHAISVGDVAKEDRDVITKALIDREKSMSTGIGNGVAIPHCTTTRVHDIVIVFMINHKGIDFDSIDSLPVKISILLLVPKSKLTQHIKTLANIARLMSDDDFRESLFAVKTAEEAYSKIKKQSSSKK